MRFSLFILALASLGCNPAPAQTSNLSPKAFYDSIQLPGVQVLDVRTPAEFNSGHLANTMWADWQNPAEFDRRIASLDRAKPVFVYCLSGGRSGAAVSKLQSLGFTRVYNLAGGMNAWRNNGYAIATEEEVALVTPETLLSQINKNGISVIEFGAAWCPPCVKMQPLITTFRQAHAKDVQFIPVDAGMQASLVKHFEVEALPVFLIYKDGKLVNRLTGEQTLETLEKAIR